jgi:hypothetical protein
MYGTKIDAKYHWDLNKHHFEAENHLIGRAAKHSFFLHNKLRIISNILQETSA